MSVCGRCNVTSDLPGLWWQNCWYCSAVCSHAAGDRTACTGWNCGCSKYAKKRRNLRHHRINMRVMDDVIAENGLQEELQDRLLEETGNSNFWLGEDSSLDEPSDTEDPEDTLRATVAGLRAQAADQSTMVQAVQGALECHKLQKDLEKARMALEDIRSQQLRAASQVQSPRR